MSGRGGAMADLLVVIPCLNEGAHLADLLDHVVAEAPGARIVIADGGSTDRSRDIVAARSARNPDILLLDNPDRIQGAGVNRAVRLHVHEGAVDHGERTHAGDSQRHDVTLLDRRRRQLRRGEASTPDREDHRLPSGNAIGQR